MATETIISSKSLPPPPFQQPYLDESGKVSRPWRAWLTGAYQRLGEGWNDNIANAQTAAEFAAIGQDQTGYIDEQIEAVRTEAAVETVPYQAAADEALEIAREEAALNSIDIQGALDDLEQRLRAEFEQQQAVQVTDDTINQEFDNFGSLQQLVTDAISGVVTTFEGRSGAVVSAVGDYNFNELSGNIAVSQMNSGTAASSSTYWRGDGTWATVSGGGSVNVTRTTLTVPANTVQEYSAVVVDAVASTTSKVQCRLVLNTTTDQNGYEELADMNVFAIPATGSITFTITKPGPFVGPFYVDYWLA